MTEAIIVAVLSLAGTLAGAYLANRKSAALLAYRLEQLEKKVNQHNRVVERTYALEETVSLLGERVKVANHRITDLEKSHRMGQDGTSGKEVTHEKLENLDQGGRYPRCENGGAGGHRHHRHQRRAGRCQLADGGKRRYTGGHPEPADQRGGPA